MAKFLVFLIMIMALEGCSDHKVAGIGTVPAAGKRGLKSCNFNWKEKLETFYSAVPGNFRDVSKDSAFLEELKICPREQTIIDITSVRNAHANDDEIQAKSAYLFIKLKHDEKAEREKLLSLYRSFKNLNGNFRTDHLIDMICDVVINDDANKEFLSDVFDLVPETNGATAEMLSGTLAAEFEKKTTEFLRKLKSKSKKIRQQVYAFLFYSSGKDKVIKSVTSIAKTSDVYAVVTEIENFARNSK